MQMGKGTDDIRRINQGRTNEKSKNNSQAEELPQKQWR